MTQTDRRTKGEEPVRVEASTDQGQTAEQPPGWDTNPNDIALVLSGTYGGKWELSHRFGTRSLGRRYSLK